MHTARDTCSCLAAALAPHRRPRAAIHATVPLGSRTHRCAQARASLMLRVVAPEFVGVEHLKWMLQFSDTYATRRSLVEQLLRSFYGVLWNRYHPLHTAVHLHVITGARAERAVVHVHANHWYAARPDLHHTRRASTRPGRIDPRMHPSSLAPILACIHPRSHPSSLA